MLKTIKGLQGVKTLNANEQKNTQGGVAAVQMSCNCIGSVGSWTGSYTLGQGEVWADIHAYCSSGHGWCNTIAQA